MLIFGKAVSDWKEKAAYAEDKADNEYAKIHEVRCEGIDDVQTAFAAMAAFAADTKCKQFLYHATINLNPGERLTREQWQKCVDTLEKNLNLAGHYRVVFEHIKKNRQHYHIVWSRIPPAGNGNAVNMGNDFYVHQNTAKALEKEFGLKPAPRRDRNEPSRKKQETNDRNSKVRIKPDIVSKEVTKIFRESKTTAAFVTNLAKAGYTLTRGKNGSYVIVDKQGGYHGLLRRIEGVRLKDLNRKFPDLDKMPLPALNAVLRSRRPKPRPGFRRATQMTRRIKTARWTGVLNGPRPTGTRFSNVVPRKGNFPALLAMARSRYVRPERKYYPAPFMRRRRKKKKYENEPEKLDPNRGEIEKALWLEWAWLNGRYDVLRDFGYHFPPEMFEP